MRQEMNCQTMLDSCPHYELDPHQIFPWVQVCRWFLGCSGCRLDEVEEALDDVRWRIQQVVNKQVRARRTPQIRFRPDAVLAGALRIEEILRGIDDDPQQDRSSEVDSDPEVEATDDAN